MRNTLGVIVGRFHEAELHDGHNHLINFVRGRHTHVLVVLGVRPCFPTGKHPLSYEMREGMIRSSYPNVMIAPLFDHPSDEEWSNSLDALIAAHHFAGSAILYGSRDCFAKVYSGRFPVKDVPELEGINATREREACVQVTNSVDFRRGVIHTQMTRAPILYPVVDVAVIREDRGEVLLGGKTTDGGKLRFIGGFVDATDPNLESAAQREVHEEASLIEVADFRYVGSASIADWRYAGSGDGIMTAFFRALYIFGAPTAQDDIVTITWVPLEKMMGSLVEEHKPLGAMLIASIAADLKRANLKPTL